MTELIFFDTLRQSLWVAVIISIPILGVALVAGVSVGLFQALTSIQEMTLTFIPKLAAIVVVFWVSMGFMTETLVNLFQNRLIPLIIGADMENAGYVTLTRQAGLLREMQIVANNIANAATTGYRQEGLVFSEYVERQENGSSVSMATASARNTSMLQGAMTSTNGQFDLAIEGDGFFVVETPQGPRLTRAGSFSPNEAGDLVSYDGHRVLDAGGAPIFIPPDASAIGVAADGTISADGRLVAQLGVVRPLDTAGMVREGSALFNAETGYEQSEEARVLQGFLENSNVDPISQVARMIEIQRAYEMGQSLLQSEDERIREAVKTMIK